MGIAVLMGLMAFGSMGASAADSPLTEIPHSLSDYLGIDLYMAKMILSAAILVAVGIAMTMLGKRANQMATMIVMLVVLGVLCGIQWLDTWVLLVVAILLAVTFGTTAKKWITG